MSSNVRLPQIRARSVQAVLAAGFIVVIVLLGLAASVAVGRSRQIARSMEHLISEQVLISRLVHDVRVEEDLMVHLLRQVSGRENPSDDPAVLLARLDATRARIAGLLAERRNTPGGGLWRDLDRQTERFADGIRAAMRAPRGGDIESIRPLFDLHDRVLGIVDTIISISSRRLTEMEEEIQGRTMDLGDNATVLLSLGLVVSVAGAVFTMRFVGRSIRVIQWQTGELTRVSWHMLQNQEAAARRFSHELHDELGQSLAAIRSNLTRASRADPEVIRRDCLALVDDSIRNVRELSQLLRPVILDDLGLHAGLTWLAESSSGRLPTAVTFESNTQRRYPDEVETHLFRICQEALTNIARHSGAAHAAIRLEDDGARVVLTIEDDGVGLPTASQPESRPGSGIGMVSMRARARQMGGELEVVNLRPHGLRIQVQVPVDTAAEPEVPG